MKPKIAVIGCGNVGFHIAKALQSIADVKIFRARGNDSLPDDADFYILTVTDNAISCVMERIPETNGIILHTSGSTPISVLASRKRFGVIYPLQTFTKDKELNMKSTPIFIEASDSEALLKIEKLAKSISDSVQKADSETRLRLHISAVFACNFACRMWAIADGLLHECDTDFNILTPLVNETLQKALEISPEKAQTGPARRNDTVTIQRHLDFLSSTPEIKELYKSISSNITKEYQS